MGRPWLKNGRTVYEGGRPVHCDTCPCVVASGCQCLLHYYAVYCREDRTGNPRWLTVAEVQACFPAMNLVAVTANIFYVDGSEGDGCFDLGGVELPSGWDPWCDSGGPSCPAGPEDPCPGGNIWCLAVWVGAFNCQPCDKGATLADCVRPGSYPSLPADPTMLPPCGA